MQQSVNGVPANTLHDATWIKSRRSAIEGNCVELAVLADGRVAVRNSREPDGPALIYSRAVMTAFLEGARSSEFGGLVT